MVSSGDTASCGPSLLGVPLFSLTLDQLNIPKLEDVPQDLRDALDEAATNGIPPEA